MKEITLILNALLMWVFGLGSVASQIKLQNVGMYPESYGVLSQSLPAISAMAVKVEWVWWVLPTVWSILSIVVVLLGRRKPEKMADAVQLHTSATLLIGVSMLVFFVVAGVLPFITLIVGMK